MRLGVLGALSPLSLLVGEAFVRLASPQPVSYLDAYRRHPDLPLFTLQADAERFIDTGETRWELRTDAAGHRVTAPGRKDAPDDRPVVLVLGDSFTFGYGVDYERTFVAALARRAADLRFVNTAVPGYGPTQYRQLLEHALAGGLRPRAVLVGIFVGNDFYDVGWSKDLPVHEGVIGAQNDAKDWVRRSSHLYRLLTKAYHARGRAAQEARTHEEETYRPECWQRSPLREARLAVREELGRIAALCAERGIEVRAVVIPATRGAGGAGAPGLDPDLPVREAQAACEAAAIPCLDATLALRLVPVSDSYFKFDSHLTPLGHALVADAIAAAWPLVRGPTPDASVSAR